MVGKMMNKKLLMFLFGIVLVAAAVSAVDAALCRGFDGYYHDCGYSYGHNSYGKGYGGHSYGKHVITLGGVKKYNPINDYYIYSGPGYDRTRKDAKVKYVYYKKDYDKRKVVYVNHYEPEVRKVRYISDERHYEPRHSGDGRQLSIRLVGSDYDHREVKHTGACGVVANKHSDPHSHKCGGEVIRLGGQSDDSIWHDGNPYHYVNDHDHNVQTWKLKGEKSCVDGFVCISGEWY